ncbi:MAG: bile acid:sodium symporter, partial [Candidatus Thorarchaeota archaeon]
MSESRITESKHLGLFEKYLPLWVVVCMVTGILLSQVLPSIGEAIDSMQFGGISIPIGIFLFLMMYPAMLNIQTSELRKLRRAPKPIILTLFSNWIVAPIVGFLLANLFLGGNPQLIVAIILLSSSPCTAMVLVWGYLAEGNQEQNIINTSLNTATIIFLYAPIVALLTGIAAIQIDRWLLFVSVLLFIGKDFIRLVLGPQWDKAGEIFSFLGPAIGIMLIYRTHGWLHLSLGRADRYFRWGIVSMVVTI